MSRLNDFMSQKRERLRAALLTLLGGSLSALGQEVASVETYKRMSLEELMAQEVVSVSRTPQPLSSAPMAIDLLTNEDIHRYGATTLADSLRLAPGLHVARYVGGGYAISARGFNSASANKLQVLMDGRPLWSPLFSGVFWEAQDVVLEDVDRIEVIRGPGSASWGANAVNGVVNIMTKSARETQGTLIQGGGGLEETGYGTVRYGGEAGSNTFYRAYAKYRYRDEQVLATGADAGDFSQHTQAGFRTDSYLQGENQLTFQGDLFLNQFGGLNGLDADNNGGNILGRWVKTFSDTSSLRVQAFYDRTDRDVPRQYSEIRDNWDLDLQHTVQFGERHTLTWGLGERITADQTGTGTFTFEPADRTLARTEGFLQDEIELVPERFRLLVGSRFEYNELTGFELQPTVRGSWLPTEHHVIWAAASRGVRTPTRIEHDSRFRATETGPLVLRSDSEFDSEELWAFETGYRLLAHERFTADLALFYNVYDGLRTVEPAALPPGLPFVIRNELEANTYGGELTLRAEIIDDWRLIASYALLEKDLDFSRASRSTTSPSVTGNDPEHIFTLRSQLDLPHGIYFDQVLRYVAELPAPRVDAYLELDLQLGWRPIEGLELALIASSLLDRSHPEFNDSLPVPVEVQRSIHGRVTWEF